ncbi:MAG: alpha/beta fold hydrolase [Acidimicrobiia bacterium]
MSAVPSLVDAPGGVGLAVHDLGGPAAGATLVLAHATGFHGRVFRPLVAAGLDRRFRCLAPDLRGHGDSTATAEVLFDDWDGFAADVAAVAAMAAGLCRPVVGFGHSLGGAALAMAEAAAPGSFSALFLYEPILVPPGPGSQLVGAASPEFLASAAERRRTDFGSTEEALANFAAKPPLSVLDGAALRAYVEGGFTRRHDGTVTIKCRPDVEAAVYRSGSDTTWFGRLGDVRAPTTIGVGGHDPDGPAAWAPAIVDRLRRGRLCRFDDLGHFGPLERPAEVAAAVLEAFAPGEPLGAPVRADRSSTALSHRAFCPVRAATYDVDRGRGGGPRPTSDE